MRVDPQAAADLEGLAQHGEEGIGVLRVGRGRPDHNLDAGQAGPLQEGEQGGQASVISSEKWHTVKNGADESLALAGQRREVQVVRELLVVQRLLVVLHYVR